MISFTRSYPVAFALSLLLCGCNTLQSAYIICIAGFALTYTNAQFGPEDCIDNLDGRDPYADAFRDLFSPPREVTAAIQCNTRSDFTCDNPDNERGLCTELIADGGFDMNTYRAGAVPTAAGFWEGDLAVPVTNSDAENSNVRGCDGGFMLQFQATTPYGPNAQWTAAEVFQIVDLSGQKALVSGGGVKVLGRSLFARVLGDEETDELFVFVIYAMAGEKTAAPDIFRNKSWLDRVVIGKRVYGSENPTWNEALAELVLPPQTDFLLVQVGVSENVVNDGADPEFDGHFADAVKIQLGR